MKILAPATCFFIVIYTLTSPSAAQTSDPPQLYVSYCYSDTDTRVTPPLDGINCGYAMIQSAMTPSTAADLEDLTNQIRQLRATPNAVLLNWIPLPKGNGNLVEAAPISQGSIYVTYMFIPLNGGIKTGSTTLKNRSPPDSAFAFFRLEETIKTLTNSRPTIILNWVSFPN